MSIRNKSKDNLKIHGGVELVDVTFAPASDDPLRFWTNHPIENTLVDLHIFAEGEYKNPSPNGGGTWSGSFNGRSELISELAPAIQARLTLAAKGTVARYRAALRAFWRVFDQLESMTTPGGRSLDRLTSVKNLTHLHEAAALRTGMNSQMFGVFVTLAEDIRRLMRLGPLLWTPPSGGSPIRQLIPDDQAKVVKIAIKRDWERVRKSWARCNGIMLGEIPDTLSEYEKQDVDTLRQYAEENDVMRSNWLYLKQIQKTTKRILPKPDQFFDDTPHRSRLRSQQGIYATMMRAVAFPCLEDADIAFHMALTGSGWNSSTLVTGIDATMPERVFQHPKDQKQAVLVVEEHDEKEEDTEEVTMQGSKRRAGGRLQFCMGLKKNPDSPPNIVAAYLERTKGLRDQLRQDIVEARSELEQLKAQNAPRADVEYKFTQLQTLQQGFRNVWLYVDKHGKINWIDGSRWARYKSTITEDKISYLDCVIERLNLQRMPRGENLIARIVPSDLRDIYARWVYIQTGGNILAVMFALGHAGLRSTNGYLNNNIFNAENDDTTRRFMTHLFQELEQGRVDLTILAQLVEHGPLTIEMQERLDEYRSMMRSRVKTGCADPMHPPLHIAPDHIEGKWCGTQRCLRDCPNARFLPDSLDGIAMRVEELRVMSDYLPLDTWLRGEFESELEAGEYLLADLYPQHEVDKARVHWRGMVQSGKHVVPGVGIINNMEAA